MTNYRWICLDRYAATLIVALMALTAGSMNETPAQIKQTMRVNVNATPAVSVSRMDAGAQRAFADEMPQLVQLFQERSRGLDTISFGSRLSISSFENVTLLLSFTVPELIGQSKSDSSPVRITCGYLNDGTTYFRRATFSEKSPIRFRLRNKNLLKRSMQSNDPLFVAYVFFLIDQRKGETRYDGVMPVTTVTVEIL
jgi:hypothetical protein